MTATETQNNFNLILIWKLFLYTFSTYTVNYCLLVNANQKYITLLVNSRQSKFIILKKNAILNSFCQRAFWKYYTLRVSLCIVLNLFIYLKIWTYLSCIRIYYIGLSVKLTILKIFAFRQKLCVWRSGHSKVLS